ncbi:MAG TPA: hypothetical protein VGG64_17830 [Pirellulales bacterium]|jgi:hypothetical protein
MPNDTPMLDVLSGPRGKFSVHRKVRLLDSKTGFMYEFDNEGQAREFVMSKRDCKPEHVKFCEQMALAEKLADEFGGSEMFPDEPA